MEKQVEQRKRFTSMTKDAKLLEKQINEMIKEFEKKHKLSCWVSNKQTNKIAIEIAIDSTKL